MVNVYLVDIRALAGREQIAGKLVGPLRREKALRQKRAAGRRRSLAAGLLLRHVLGVVEDVAMQYGPQGKPYRPDLPAFNLSHSGHYSVLAVGSERLGIDIEQQRPFQMAVAARFFSEAEYNYLAAAADQISTFFRLWTCKESVLKGIGCGLQMTPRDFSVLPLDQSAHSIAGADWYFAGLCHDGHQLTVATTTGPITIVLQVITADDLLTQRE